MSISLESCWLFLLLICVLTFYFLNASLFLKCFWEPLWCPLPKNCIKYDLKNETKQKYRSRFSLWPCLVCQPSRTALIFIFIFCYSWLWTLLNPDYSLWFCTDCQSGLEGAWTTIFYFAQVLLSDPYSNSSSEVIKLYCRLSQANFSCRPWCEITLSERFLKRESVSNSPILTSAPHYSRTVEHWQCTSSRHFRSLSLHQSPYHCSWGRVDDEELGQLQIFAQRG